MYIMKEEYKTGIDLIDEQHAKLFELANEVYNLVNDQFITDKYDKIVNLIEELKEYAAFHFASEEEYMEKINYKKMFTQKIEHSQFIDKFNNINLNEIDNNQDEYVANLLKFLTDWLVEHIIEKDKLISNS